ncbi:MAG: hypothetical protein Q4C16_07840 [Eubacteriales bacterium]|nr:hypothetical protein [Eubacteriales bacterium]
MRLVNMTCPNCGAQLQVDVDRKQAYCEHCGTKLFMQDDVHHIVYDNAEDAGYKFEKGRQRAQEERERRNRQGRSIPPPPQPLPPPPPKKKSRLWLWILGWIIIFPVPLTILLLRSRRWSPRVRYGIIALAWVVYLGLAMSGNNKDTDNGANTDSGTHVEESAEREGDQDSEPASDEADGDSGLVSDQDSKSSNEEADGDSDLADKSSQREADGDSDLADKSADDELDKSLEETLKEVERVTESINQMAESLDKMTTPVDKSTGNAAVQEQETEDVDSKEKSPDSEEGKAVSGSSGNSKDKAKGTAKDKTGVDENGVTLSFKEEVDAYEEFMNEYCDFMDHYDSSDLSMLAQFTKIMAKYAQYTGKMEEIDESELSPADSAYYLEANTRILKRLSEVEVGN